MATQNMYDALFSEIWASNSLRKTVVDTHALRKDQRNAFGDVLPIPGCGHRGRAASSS